MVRARFFKKPGPRDVGPDDHFEIGETYMMTQRSFDRWKALGCVEEVPADPKTVNDDAVERAEPRIERAMGRNRYRVFAPDGKELTDRPVNQIRAEEIKRDWRPSPTPAPPPEPNGNNDGASVSAHPAEPAISD